MREVGVRRLIVVSAAPIGAVPSPARPRPPRHDPGDGFFMRHLAAPLTRAALRRHYADPAHTDGVRAQRAPRPLGRPRRRRPLHARPAGAAGVGPPDRRRRHLTPAPPWPTNRHMSDRVTPVTPVTPGRARRPIAMAPDERNRLPGQAVRAAAPPAPVGGLPDSRLTERGRGRRPGGLVPAQPRRRLPGRHPAPPRPRRLGVAQQALLFRGPAPLARPVLINGALGLATPPTAGRSPSCRSPSSTARSPRSTSSPTPTGSGPSPSRRSERPPRTAAPTAAPSGPSHRRPPHRGAHRLPAGKAGGRTSDYRSPGEQGLTIRQFRQGGGAGASERPAPVRRPADRPTDRSVGRPDCRMIRRHPCAYSSPARPRPATSSR